MDEIKKVIKIIEDDFNYIEDRTEIWDILPYSSENNSLIDNILDILWGINFEEYEKIKIENEKLREQLTETLTINL